MNKMTITEAAKIVLTAHPEGLTVEEIYNYILEQCLYSFKAKQPYNVLLGTIRRQCYGIDFPSAYPIKHFKHHEIDGKTIYSLLDENKAIPLPSKCETRADSISNDLLPEERIQDSYVEHIETLKKQLLDAVLDEDKTKTERAAFFEKLVVDLILRLGYGADEKSGFITGRSHDGGIDGVIHEDKLGLDKIYIQAKCYAQTQNVSSKDVQAFVGAMTNVQKGIFVTTSRFSKEAHKYVEKQQTKNIKLIDGEALTALMVKHAVGLTEIKLIPIYKINRDYFSINF